MSERLDKILHDAQHAFGGMEMARRMNDGDSVRALQGKAARLYAKAVQLDPEQLDPAWRE